MSNIPGAMSESVDQCRKKLRSGDETGTNGGQQEEVENPILLRRSGGVISPDFNCSAVFPEEQSCNTRRFQLSAALRQLHSVILFFVGNDFTSPRVVSDLDLINSYAQQFQAVRALPVVMTLPSLSAGLQQYTCKVPILFDTTYSVSRYFNVLDSAAGNSTKRAVFIIDRQRQIQFSFIVEDDRISHSMMTILTMAQSIP
ncbi:hypothetical protein VTP01DRAFT_7823 [Rhizomucor pusillus]|uniref:uncharacterized protein n=1 Tax=Rhizomucor pusillus TaxID=4840 RepID=UPI0037444A43